MRFLMFVLCAAVVAVAAVAEEPEAEGAKALVQSLKRAEKAQQELVKKVSKDLHAAGLLEPKPVGPIGSGLTFQVDLVDMLRSKGMLGVIDQLSYEMYELTYGRGEADGKKVLALRKASEALIHHLRNNTVDVSAVVSRVLRDYTEIGQRERIDIEDGISTLSRGSRL